MSIHPSLKRPQVSGFFTDPIEKYIIRKSFDTSEIEKNILWNSRKDISTSFNTLSDFLTSYFNSIITDTEFYNYTENNTENNTSVVPNSKEEMYYKKTFNSIYPNMGNVINYYWDSLLK